MKKIKVVNFALKKNKFQFCYVGKKFFSEEKELQFSSKEVVLEKIKVTYILRLSYTKASLHKSSVNLVMTKLKKSYANFAQKNIKVSSTE